MALLFGGQMRFYFVAAIAAVFCSELALAIYGGGSLPAEMQGAARVVRIETDFTCSAVVLDSTTLLTAGHCAEGLYSLDAIKVLHPDTGDKTRTKVLRMVRHPNYREGFADDAKIDRVFADIALIKLKDPISFPHAGVKVATDWDLQHLGQFDIWLVANGSTPRSNTSHNSALQMLLRDHAYDILESESLRASSGPCINDSGGGYFVIVSGQVRVIGIQSSKNATECDAANSRGYVVNVPSNLGWLQPYLP